MKRANLLPLFALSTLLLGPDRPAATGQSPPLPRP